MNKKEQEKHNEEFFAKQKAIFDKKGNDYADEDRLSNFKYAASITQLKPEQVILVMVAIKVARLGVLLSENNRGPENESISDSIVDLANYSVLLNAVLEDGRGDNKLKGGNPKE